MFSYKSLENIIGISIKLYKHGQCLYSVKGVECPYEYENGSYTIYTSQKIDSERLSLIQLLINQNEQSQPFWIRVFKNLTYLEDEIPNAFKETTSYQLWIVKGKNISEDITILEALFEFSEIISLTSDRLLVVINDKEQLTPKDVIGHFEAEVMKVIKVYVGPKVKQFTDLRYAYNQTLILEDIVVSKHVTIIDYNSILFERVIHELSEDVQEQLLEGYLTEYPIHHLNSELLETTTGFFKNNLNVTDTANELFLHRNTLIYRLNKISQVTNLDIRNFEDACKLRILLTLYQNKNR
ncbi:MAG: helix-turn-helix domain-containing protein [Clostridiales bacterium]|nr:helix-turn-helix domain-containing protein [Clostridiales bacterium]